MALFGKGLLSGLAGNMNELSPEDLQKEYGAYLMEDETVSTGFRLVRDVVLFTDKRIIDFDKQGATGQKMSVKYIYLASIVYVNAETAGFGIDDSELTVTYISTPFMHGHTQELSNRKFEFPKRYNIQPLYQLLQGIAYENYSRINGLA